MDSRTTTRLDRLVLTAVQARVLAVIVVVALVLPLSWAGRLGQGLVVAPAVFALVVIGSVLVAEMASRRDARGQHAAALEVRRVTDYLSAWTILAAVTSALALLAAAGWTTAVASADDRGRSGRSFSYRCVSTTCDEGSFGPFPGSFYTVPMFVGLGLVLILAVVALRVAVRRPRNGADPTIRETDEWVRRLSVRSVVAAVTLAASGSLAGVGLYASRGLLTDFSDVSSGLRVAGVLLVVAGFAGLLLMCWALVMLIAPLLDRPRSLGPARVRPVRTPQ